MASEEAIKRCTKCGEEKPIGEFYTGMARCKACVLLAAKRRYRGESTKTIAAGRVCDRCGTRKPVSEFEGKSRMRHTCEAQSALGRLETPEQLESAVRAMAESRGLLDAEVELYEQRVAMIQQYSRDITEPLEGDVAVKQALIGAYMRKTYGTKAKKGTLRCKYGSIEYKRGEVAITLDTKRALDRREKP